MLDLVYEARDIDQRLGSEDKIDAWFEAKTKGLNDWQKDELKKQWGTMQNVLSSRSRMERVVSDIVFDFSVKPRLSSERGNAILVASSIYEACKYFTLFQKTPFKGKCAVVTSYNPQAQDVTMEETGANTETDKQFIYNTYTELLKDVEAKPGMTKTETYEERAKALFTKEPANMKLLVVVDKLLTGFDAPPCTYLYIDKSMQDHGLFQAICRTNRLDGEDKDFGYIVDYKDLFKKVENAIAVYTSELDHSAGGADPEVLLQDRLKKGKERLDNALEALALLCEPVEPPKGELEHIHYFCGNTEIPADLEEREPQRAALYKATVALVRAYANIADELEPAGYSAADIGRIKQQLDHYLNVREIIRKASGESLDLKAYEADMRHLIDTYIEADEPRKISPFDNMGLLELIVKTGIADAIAAQLGGLKGNKNAIAETIENNVRSKIIKEHLNDPAFYEKMSALLDEIIAARKAKAIEYEEYLKRIAELAKRVEAGRRRIRRSSWTRPGKRALYNNLRPGTRRAGARRSTQTRSSKRQMRGPDGWRGVQAREQVIKAALYDVLQDDGRGGAHLPHHQGAERILMVYADRAGRHRGGRGPEGHQERPSQRLSADRPGAHLGPVAHEPRHHPRLRHLQAGLDQAAAEEAAGAGTRDAARVPGSGKPLRLGKALPAQGHRERCSRPSIELKHNRMLLRVRPGTDEDKRQAHRRGMVSRAAQGGCAAA